MDTITSLLKRLSALSPVAKGLLGLGSAAVLLRLLLSAQRRRAFYARHSHSTLLITGASKGVGRETALLLSSALPHSRLVLLARTESELQALAEQLRATGRPGAVLTFAVDCTVPAQLQGVAAAVGACDVVIANAGVGVWRAIYEADASPEETARCLAAPLASALHTAHAFLPAMLAGRGGVFLCTQSPASRLPWPGATAYTAARWGLAGLCASLAQELPQHVRVSEVVLAEISDSAYFSTSNPGSKDRVPSVSPLFGRLSCRQAAGAVLAALEQGHRQHTAPWQLRWGLGALWLPGAHAAVSALVRATGWRAGRSSAGAS